MMSQKAFHTLAVGLLPVLFLTGCPWSQSPNVFDGAKGISMPNLSGPPAQSEPPLADESTSLESDRSDVDFE